MILAWQVEITADTSKERFVSGYTEMKKEKLKYLWEFFKFEEENEVAWCLNDFARGSWEGSRKLWNSG